MEEILFTELSARAGKIGLITLNRPAALNALNLIMIRALATQLKQWATDDTIKAVLIRAVEGRAFCAGGDIRLIYQNKLIGDPNIMDFFREEYLLNHSIFHYPKPYIALLDGITMGGGAGISIHGSHRIATENVLFAMPETGIGFHPDIGASYFLSRLPHRLGFYLGLTGARINYSDCLALKLVDTFIPRDARDKLIQLLVNSHLLDKKTITNLLQSITLPMPPSELLKQKKEIAKHFNKNSIEEIFYSLKSSKDDFSLDTLKTLHSKCPTSLKVTFTELTRAEKLDFDACMKTEYHVTNHFIAGKNFHEGIRAAVIDKDQTPRWQPSMVEQVTKEEVESYFISLGQELLI